MRESNVIPVVQRQNSERTELRAFAFVLTGAWIAAALVGCATQRAGDGRDDSFLGSGGKADDDEIADGSEDAIAILKLVNTATADELRAAPPDGVGLDDHAVDNIVYVRLGDDGVAGTADDTTFTTLAQLDAVPYVGPIAFQQLLDYTRTHLPPTYLRVTLNDVELGRIDDIPVQAVFQIDHSINDPGTFWLTAGDVFKVDYYQGSPVWRYGCSEHNGWPMDLSLAGVSEWLPSLPAAWAEFGFDVLPGSTCTNLRDAADVQTTGEIVIIDHTPDRFSGVFDIVVAGQGPRADQTLAIHGVFDVAPMIVNLGQ
jgi:hypothetical protein